MYNSVKWRGWFDVEWVIGGVTYTDTYNNALYDQGEQDILEVFFRGATAPTGFVIGLLNTSYSLTETHGMANITANELTDVTAPGYSVRKALTRDATGWPTSALNGGDWQITSSQQTWTATGAWSATAGFIFLNAGGTTTPGNTTGRLLAVAAISPTRQLQAVDDTLRVTYNIKLQ